MSAFCSQRPGWILGVFAVGVLLNACGGTGGDGGGTPPAPLNPAGTALYVSYYPGMAAFQIDAGSGQLTPVAGSPLPVSGSRPVFRPNGATMYVNLGSAGLAADATTGVLTSVAGSPFSANGSGQPAIDPSGRFLYLGTVSNGLLGFSIDQTSGAVSALPSSPFATGGVDGVLVIDPTGKNLYVPNGPAVNLAGFSINESTGGLTPVPAVMNAPLDSHNQASVDRSGSFLYANDTANKVYRYTIDPQGGGLDALDSVTIGGNGGGRPVLVGSQ